MLCWPDRDEMALPSEFPESPSAPPAPVRRWFPADETLRNALYEKLLPPLVAKIREHVNERQQKGYAEASATPVSLQRLLVRNCAPLGERKWWATSF